VTGAGRGGREEVRKIRLQSPALTTEGEGWAKEPFAEGKGPGGGGGLFASGFQSTLPVIRVVSLRRNGPYIDNGIHFLIKNCVRKSKNYAFSDIILLFKKRKSFRKAMYKFKVLFDFLCESIAKRSRDISILLT
jgi:hypothetical protein